jgi:hypothetical protein
MFSFFISNKSNPESVFALWIKQLQLLKQDFRFKYKLDPKFEDIEAVPLTALFTACSFDLPEVIGSQAEESVKLAVLIKMVLRYCMSL